MENLNKDFGIDDLLLCISLNGYVKIKGFDEDTKLFKIELIDKVDRPKDNQEVEDLKLTAIEQTIVTIKESILGFEGEFEKALEFDDQNNPETFYDHELTWKSFSSETPNAQKEKFEREIE